MPLFLVIQAVLNMVSIISTYANRNDVLFTATANNVCKVSLSAYTDKYKPKRYNSYKKRGYYYGSKS